MYCQLTENTREQEMAQVDKICRELYQELLAKEGRYVDAESAEKIIFARNKRVREASLMDMQDPEALRKARIRSEKLTKRIERELKAQCMEEMKKKQQEEYFKSLAEKGML